MFAPISTSGPMIFRKLQYGGYEVTAEYHASSPLLCIDEDVRSEDGSVLQTTDGHLYLFPGFVCDGPSGPTLDTPDFLPGSFIHDGGYKLCREAKVDHRIWRKRYDQVLHDLCELKGMGWFRRQYVYRGVRLFSGFAAKPANNVEKKTYRVP